MHRKYNRKQSRKQCFNFQTWKEEMDMAEQESVFNVLFLSNHRNNVVGQTDELPLDKQITV